MVNVGWPFMLLAMLKVTLSVGLSGRSSIVREMTTMNRMAVGVR